MLPITGASLPACVSFDNLRLVSVCGFADGALEARRLSTGFCGDGGPIGNGMTDCVCCDPGLIPSSAGPAFPPIMFVRSFEKGETSEDSDNARELRRLWSSVPLKESRTDCRRRDIGQERSRHKGDRLIPCGQLLSPNASV